MIRLFDKFGHQVLSEPEQRKGYDFELDHPTVPAADSSESNAFKSSQQHRERRRSQRGAEWEWFGNPPSQADESFRPEFGTGQHFGGFASSGRRHADTELL
eukprot:SAG31_NODE_4523_length_3168_cov_1.746497_3_plen_101_part_00